MNESIYNAIGKTLKEITKRDVKRRELKQKIDEIAIEADDDDYKLIHTITNCILKLPNMERLEEDVGKEELITSFIDPILQPMFHDPEQGMTFRWLNRTVDDSSASKRPDKQMLKMLQKVIHYSAGFVEVKAQDRHSSTLLTHEDTLRLMTFCSAVIDGKKNTALIAAQAVGYYLSFYLFTRESSGLYIMVELLSVEIPKSIKELPEFFTHIDDLKKVMFCYQRWCVVQDTAAPQASTSNKRSSPSLYPIQDVINIKKPKTVRASLSFK